MVAFELVRKLPVSFYKGECAGEYIREIYFPLSRELELIA